MKKLVLTLILLTFAMPAAFAKKKPKLTFDHVATMTYHDSKISNPLDGRKDLYESGQYTCTPGDEHHAPDCRLYADWIHTDAESYIDIALDNGEEIVVTNSLCEAPLDCRTLEPWDHDKVHTVLRGTVDDVDDPVREFAIHWELGDMMQRRSLDQYELLKDRAKKLFHYALIGDEIVIDPIDVIHASSR